MDDLITWLRAQLDEDEERFRFDTGDHYADGEGRWRLADIAAKRAILDLHGGEHECPYHAPFERIESVWWGLPVGGGMKWCPTLRLLASAYAADHPGYREEWRPV